MDTPFFSIVLPTYNVAEHIERCIISLHHQNFPPMEMLFVDDCGQDDSIAIISSYASKDERIRIISSDKNRGTYHARHLGVKHARGEYIVFIDPDDELDENFLTALHAHLLSTPSDIIFFGVTLAPRKKWYQSSLNRLPKPNQKRLLEATFTKTLCAYRTITYGTPGKAYRRTFIEKVYEELDIDRGFRFVYSEDNLVFFTAALKNPTYSVFPTKGYRYHVNYSSITYSDQSNTRSAFIIDQVRFSIEKTREMIAQSDVTKIEKEFFTFFFGRSTDSWISFTRRFENEGSQYLQRVWKAFILLPDIKLLARIMVYLLSFGNIKL